MGFHKYGGRVSPTLWPHLGHLLNCLAKIPGSVGFHKYGGRRVSPTLCPIWEVKCSKGQQSKGGEGGGEHSRIAKIPGGYPICSVVGVRILHTFIETSYLQYTIKIILLFKQAFCRNRRMFWSFTNMVV